MLQLCLKTKILDFIIVNHILTKDEIAVTLMTISLIRRTLNENKSFRFDILEYNKVNDRIKVIFVASSLVEHSGDTITFRIAKFRK